MALKLDWRSLAVLVAQAVLGSNSRTAPIVNEVIDGITEAEGLFKQGSDKKAHVLAIAKKAAQAADELRGGVDDSVGDVGTAVDHIVGTVNAIRKISGK